MVKTFILEDLDCAHCAAKIEEEVGKLEGVLKSTCTFLTQKLTLEIDESKAGSITKDVKKVVKKFEPDVTVVEQ
ncbi:MAG: heavy-metal-associated domain-containing protein [Lachnospiraceae bacterium]|nr:heavy-metal-associated domain-containing protein [Lachnospiraceae bacterium]